MIFSDELMSVKEDLQGQFSRLIKTFENPDLMLLLGLFIQSLFHKVSTLFRH
jgi:hypothetical protein